MAKTLFPEGAWIFVDTCTLEFVSDCKENLEEFWEHLCSLASEASGTIFIASSVISEVMKRRDRDAEGGVRFERLLSTIKQMAHSNQIELVNDHQPEGSFADPFFINIVNSYKMRRPLCFLTQDVNLMKSIYLTVETPALSGRVRGSNGGFVQRFSPKPVIVYKVRSSKGAPCPSDIVPFKPRESAGETACKKRLAEENSVVPTTTNSCLPVFKPVGGGK